LEWDRVKEEGHRKIWVTGQEITIICTYLLKKLELRCQAIIIPVKSRTLESTELENRENIKHG
jgi:hypothetical protein